MVMVVGKRQGRGGGGVNGNRVSGCTILTALGRRPAIDAVLRAVDAVLRALLGEDHCRAGLVLCEKPRFLPYKIYAAEADHVLAGDAPAGCVVLVAALPPALGDGRSQPRVGVHGGLSSAPLRKFSLEPL